jgi:hypothetical protein
MVAAATLDCYNDSECVTGFYTMIDEHLERSSMCRCRRLRQAVRSGSRHTVTG